MQTLQENIQERTSYLIENNLDSYSDPTLLEYYELYGQIQRCLFSDHSDQYLLIAILAIGIPVLVFIRWRMIKKGQSIQQ